MPGDVVLQGAGPAAAARDQFGVDLDGIALEVRAGEVVGIAGVSGNGQQELLYALSGEDTRAPPARSRCSARTPRASARARGARWACISCPRSGWAAAPCPRWRWRTTCCSRAPKRSAGAAGSRMRRAGASRRSHHRALQRQGRRPGCGGAQSLSGGNLQKFIVGREIDANPKLLIVSQPTWGVDVGAAAQIRGEILALRDAGCAVLVVSEELDELFEISDRLHVIAKGRLSPSSVPRATGDGRDDRRVDERAVARQPPPARPEEAAACLGSNRARRPRSSGASPRRCWRWRSPW